MNKSADAAEFTYPRCDLVVQGLCSTLVPLHQALPPGLLHCLDMHQADLPGLCQLLLHQIQVLRHPCSTALSLLLPVVACLTIQSTILCSGQAN